MPTIPIRPPPWRQAVRPVPPLPMMILYPRLSSHPDHPHTPPIQQSTSIWLPHVEQVWAFEGDNSDDDFTIITFTPTKNIICDPYRSSESCTRSTSVYFSRLDIHNIHSVLPHLNSPRHQIRIHCLEHFSISHPKHIYTPPWLHFDDDITNKDTHRKSELKSVLMISEWQEWDNANIQEVSRLAQGCEPDMPAGTSVIFFIEHKLKPAQKKATYVHIITT